MVIDINDINAERSVPKSADKNLRAKQPVIVPCINRLHDGSDVHVRDKATAMRNAPRLRAAAPYDGT